MADTTATQRRSAELPLVVALLSVEGRLNNEQVEMTLNIMKKLRCTVEEALVATKEITDVEIAERYSEHFRLPMMFPPPQTVEILNQLKGAVPERFCRDNRMVPVQFREDSLVVAMVDPSSLAVQNQLRVLTGMSVETVVSPLSKVQTAIDRLFGERDQLKEIADELVVVQQEDDSTVENLLDLDAEVEGGVESHIIRLVNRIIKGAVGDQASDIHLEPHPEELKVRLRIDGVLADITPVPKTSAVPLVSRIKILCKMDIAEKRVPQDGGMQVSYRGRTIDLRVSTVPTIWGEKVVLRILNKEAVTLDLPNLGFTIKQQEAFKVGSNASHGLLFVTGPTGSGKSTTLYTTLLMLRSPTKNLLTVEDPVEYKFPGINQTQVKPSVGLDFARCLRAFLRQDPDVIMVGEVRDAETAQICLRAALTGHLVLSTLHTNDALSTIGRLTEIGLEPFMIAASVRLIEAQRLVRRICPHCKQQYLPPEDVQQTYGVAADQILSRPVGCGECRASGYRGRIGIFEVVPISGAMASLIQDRAPVSRLKELARKEGVMSLKEHGIERAKSGVTSLEEVHRVTIVTE